MKSIKRRPPGDLAAATAVIVMALGLLAMGHRASAKEAMPADHAMDATPDMDKESMEGMDMTPDTGRKAAPKQSAAPADRDPNAYADGYDFGPLPRLRMADESNFGSLLVNRLETVHTSDNTAAAYDLQARYGRTYDRAVLKAEGDVGGGKLQEGRTELLWSHAVAPFWDAQLGARYDGGTGPERSWVALGVQGLAPYWFEVDATGYVSDAGHSALRLEVDYELLFTQRLILQPRLEVNYYGRSDGGRALGAGLADAAAGIRLRYEVRREFAPYIGVEWADKYGGTASYARAAGEPPEETRWVAGVRLSF